jgi:hypothetical protein
MGSKSGLISTYVKIFIRHNNLFFKNIIILFIAKFLVQFLSSHEIF